METPLWIGTIGMAVGTVLILLVGARAPHGERHHVYTSAGVTAIAACAYYLMTQGRFMQEVNGEMVYAARYIDWLLTTPLLLLGLLTIGMPKAGTPAGRGGIIGG
ncbi:MAG: bacteriorhodopsin, partial [Gammaproteobacteria bacterium]